MELELQQQNKDASISQVIELIPSTPAVDKVKADIIKQYKLSPADLSNIDVIIKALAIARLSAYFERIYGVIFGSQIEALRNLTKVRQVTHQDAVSFYDEIKGKYPEFYQTYSFQNWAGFLINMKLVGDVDGFYKITDMGDEFILFLTQVGQRPSRSF